MTRSRTEANEKTVIEIQMSAPGFNLFTLLANLPKGQTYSIIIEVKKKEHHGLIDN